MENPHSFRERKIACSEENVNFSRGAPLGGKISVEFQFFQSFRRRFFSFSNIFVRDSALGGVVWGIRYFLLFFFKGGEFFPGGSYR